MKVIALTAVVGALVIPALAVTAAQGQSASSPILSSLEVRNLVTSTDPAGNRRLAAHFSALADRYAADATRHDAMAQMFIATPTRRVAANSAADHCKRLARLNAQSAETLRELAAHHDKVAAGATSTPPKGGSQFAAGKGAPEPTDAELSALAAKASASDDHRRLEDYVRAAVRRYSDAATDHAALSQAYRGTRISQAAVHCDRLVQLSRDEAKAATAAADLHKRLAAEAK